MIAYKAMHDTRPDFFLHSGDNIYADGPIAAELNVADGTVWKNVVTEEVAKVAETLAEYRGRYRYNLLDHNVRDLYADVPLVAQWDDHETLNNWYPGRSSPTTATPRSASTSSRPGRGRPSSSTCRSRPPRRGDGPPGSTARSSYGPLLDVFCLDMRTYRGANPTAATVGRSHILGAEQADWLVREVAASKATWKVIASDMPLGLLVPDGPVNEEAVQRRPRCARWAEHEIAWVLTAFKKRTGPQRDLADRRRALLRRPPLRPVPRGVHRLRPVLGDRRRPDQRRHVRAERARQHLRPGGRVLEGRRLPEPVAARAATSSSATPRSTRAPESSRSRCATCSARSSGPRTSPRPTTEGPSYSPGSGACAGCRPPEPVSTTLIARTDSC